jgi:predicted MFS family arabinose efflux permease
MITQKGIAFREPLWTNNFLKIWLVNFSIAMWAFILIVIFPFYITDLGGTEMTVGLAAGGFALTCIFMRPLAGWLLDNRSRSGLLKSGMIGLAVITVLFLVAPVLSLAVVLRLVSGFVFSGVGTATNTNACDIVPKSRFSEGMAFLGLSNTLASALGPALGLLVMVHYGFNTAFIAIAVLALAAAGITHRLTYKKIDRSVARPDSSRLKLSDLFNVTALPASVLVMYATAGFGGVSAFIALYGQLSGVGSSGLFFLLMAVGTGSTRLFSGRLADKKGEKPMVLLGNCCFLQGYLLLSLFESSAAYYLSGLFLGMASGLLYPAMQAMAVRIVPPEKRGSASSTLLCSSDIGSGLGGLLAGVLVTLWGYRPMFGAMIIFVLLSLLTYALWASKSPAAFKNYKRDHGDAHA